MVGTSDFMARSKASVVEAEKERMPFDTVPNANIGTDQHNHPSDLESGTGNINGKTLSNDFDQHVGTPTSTSSPSSVGVGGFPGEKEGSVADPSQEIIVDWDGDDDPMNPRSMKHGRKWLVVLIVSASSLCVYVELHSKPKACICMQQGLLKVSFLAYHFHYQVFELGRKLA